MPEDVPHLELVLAATRAMELPAVLQRDQAIQLLKHFFEETIGTGAGALEMLRGRMHLAVAVLAASSFPAFVQSDSCAPVIEQLLREEDLSEVATCDGLLWSSYRVPEDCAGWIHAFARAAEAWPACIVLSDMSLPGNPMLFVNREFCRVTGYTKDEASGRNCRFLQGPKTESHSVAVIQDTLRRGVDCHVKITNYRKSGGLFENLLTMRPVHDSNGVYRFCIGVQFEVAQEAMMHRRLTSLKDLIQLLPSILDVAQDSADSFRARGAITLPITSDGSSFDDLTDQTLAISGRLSSRGSIFNMMTEAQHLSHLLYANNHEGNCPL